MGGLSKKAFQIEQIQSSQKGNSLILDAGNILFKQTAISKKPNQERLTAIAILDIYKRLHIDAAAVGPLDLADSIDLLKTSSKNGFPWISSNIFNKSGQSIFQQSISKKSKDTDIHIIALTGKSQHTGIIIKEANAVLPNLIASLQKKSDNPFIILLSTLSTKENKRIAEEFPEIHLIIGGDSHKGNITPEVINNCLLTQTSKQGKYQGLLEVKLGLERTWGEGAAKQLANLQNKLGSINWQLSRIEKKAAAPENEGKYTKTILRLRKEKTDLDKQIESTTNRLALEKTKGGANDQFTYRFIGLKKSLPNDPSINAILDTLNKDIKSLHTSQKDQTGNSARLTQGMVGAAVCASCHETQAEFWKTTPHASAYNTLVKGNRQFDLNCLACHLTLNTSSGETGVIINDTGYLSYPVELQSVGCESCHGSGKKHSIDPEMFTLSLQPSETVCLTCHTPEHSNTFDYALQLNQVSCPK